MEGAGGGCSKARRSIRRLVRDSLAPRSALIEPSSFALTNEGEGDLLLILTSVLREVRHWRLHTGDRHFQRDPGSPVFSGCVGASRDGCDCLEDVLALFISMLRVENLYIQHLTGKILLEIYCLLVESGDDWKEFLHLLWISFESILRGPTLVLESNHCEDVTNTCSSSSSSVMDTAQLSKKPMHILNSVTLLHLDSAKQKYFIATFLIKALRDILKFVKVNHGTLFKSCVELAVTSLSTYSWNFMKSGQKNETSSRDGSVESNLFVEKIIFTESDSLLLGMLLQLLCTAVDQKNLGGGATINDFPVYSRLTNLVHNIVSSFLGKNKDFCKPNILQYLRHKALMLMIRLSNGNYWKCSYVMLWMKLLEECFKDLLYQPIKECHTESNGALEGSPFQAGFIVEEKVDSLCSCHLQRQAIFLFLKCCFASSHFPKESECADWRQNQSLCSRNLYNWLTKHISVYNFVKCENYSLSRDMFSLSLLQLYMNEDDLLFEFLLLMEATYLNVQQQSIESTGSLLVETGFMGIDIATQLSVIFNPVHLLHLFLYLLQYDHMVLIDYLISKHTGIQCLRYLMRCLHSICRSWSIFSKFSLCRLGGLQNSQERTVSLLGKATGGCSSSQEDTWNCLTIEKSMEQESHGRKRQKTELCAFENAKNCLLSLQMSIEDFSTKNLFPYNPSALLKRFSRFQELCHGVN